MKYLKKPVVIEAFQMTRERRVDNKDWPEWLNEAWNKRNNTAGAVWPAMHPNSNGKDKLVIGLRGNRSENVTVEWGDWIIKGVEGDLYPCAQSIFEATYLQSGEEIAELIPRKFGAVVTDEMVWIAKEIFENEDTVYATWDDRYRAMIEAAILASPTAPFLHDLHTGQPSTAPTGDEELQDFVNFVVDFLRQSLLQSKAPGPQICANIVDRGTRLMEARKSMYMPYSNMVRSLFKEMDSPAATLIHAGVGISGEAGELLDALKKHWVYGKKLDVPNVLEEMGDLYFYFTHLMNTFGWTISDVQMANRLKLSKRYPDGVYTDKHAQARLDKAEGAPVETTNENAKLPSELETVNLSKTGEFKPKGISW